MSLTLKRIAAFIVAAYLILTCYTAYILLSKSSSNSKKEIQRTWSLSGEDEWNPWGEELEQDTKLLPAAENLKVKWWNNKSLNGKGKSPALRIEYNVEIWSKAAIGLYLWEHILDGKLEKKMNGIWSYGLKKIDNLKMKFRTGPGVVPSKVPTTVQNLVIVLNGHKEEKLSIVKQWMDFLPQLPLLRNLALVIHGNEQCNNDWLKPYLNAGFAAIKLIFIVYDSPIVDNESIFQWPLGVAMYREFPKLDKTHLDLEKPRPYVCNFLGTTYPNSTREKLLNIIEKNDLGKHCLVKTRNEWIPMESRQSMEAYVTALQMSDLTLSPIGKNTECYRIYEALSLGSIPVIEDVMSPGQCNDNAAYHGRATVFSGPLRLLKEHGAPFIYVSDWDELPQIIEKESLVSPAEKIRRRLDAVAWYEDFKLKMQTLFVDSVKTKFFGFPIR